MFLLQAGGFENIFKNAHTQGQSIGGAFLGVLGVILIVHAGYQLFNYFIKGERGNISLIKVFIEIIVAVFLMTNGYENLKKFGDAGKGSLEELSKTIIIHPEMIGEFVVKPVVNAVKSLF